MPIQSFDDTSLAAAPVPGRGTKGAASAPSAPPKAVGRPGKVIESDGTANLRADTQTKRAAPKSEPSGGARNKWPSGVRSYPDGV